MNFDFSAFLEKMHTDYGQDLSLEEVENLLNLEEDGYEKSTPIGLGKSLLLKKIHLLGKKRDGSIINYEKELFSGLNVWITDNLKGKSSLFKAIRYVLTGKNKLADDIKEWIHKILLEFLIGADSYTIVMDLTKSRPTISFYQGSWEGDEESLPIRTYKSDKEYQEAIQQFFFDTLNYYPLKRVQSNQHSVDLSSADLSWATYYSSIYLESRDYGNLAIGNQHAGVFQMLLGMEFTYSIFALDAKTKRLSREKDIEKKKQEQEATDEKIASEQLKNELINIQAKIQKLQKGANKTEIATKEKYLNSLHQEKEKLRKDKLHLEDEVYSKEKEAKEATKKLEQKTEEITARNQDIKKAQKRILSHEEYIEAGIFFSNLDIKVCPHCEQNVDQSRLLHEKETHSCMLCNQGMENKEVDITRWEEEIKELEQDIKRNVNLIKLYEAERKVLYQYAYPKDIEKLQAEKRLKDINLEIENNQKQINIEEAALQELLKLPVLSYFEEYEKLLTQKVDIEHQLRNIKKHLDSVEDSPLKLLEKKIVFLTKVREYLLNDRASKGETIFQQLETIVLRQLHSFGLQNYTGVRIDRVNFNVYYLKEEIESPFERISEGEQLRAKLALYLGIIELDIVNHVGRHPRLLILDSPGKEEGDQLFMEGLKDALAEIDQKFGKNIQILIGTARREFHNIVTDKKKLQIKEEGSFLF